MTVCHRGLCHARGSRHAGVSRCSTSRFCRGAEPQRRRPCVLRRVHPDRKPFAGDPRDVLRRIFRKAEKAGYLLNVGAELEYYSSPTRHPRAAQQRGLLRSSVSDAARDLRRNTVLTLEKMYSQWSTPSHAAGRSQHGMSLRHAEALSMSDAITTAKLIIKQQATRAGATPPLCPSRWRARTAALCSFASRYSTTTATTSFGARTTRSTISPISPSTTWPASWRTRARD